MTEEKENKTLLYFLEKYRFYIGGILVLLILVESIYVLWQDNYFKPEMGKKISSLENRVSTLENSKGILQKDESTGVSSLILQSQATSSDASVESVSSTPVSTPTKAAVAITPSSSIININTATAAELDLLPNIGVVRANDIINYRKEHGGFKNIDELKNIKGIGDATFNKLKDKVSI